MGFLERITSSRVKSSSQDNRSKWAYSNIDESMQDAEGKQGKRFPSLARNLFAVLFVVAACAYMWSTARMLQSWGLPSWYQVYPNYLRNQPNLVVQWQGDDRFTQNSPEADAAWEELIPTGLGHVKLTDDEIKLYGLGQGKHIPGQDGYSSFAVSAFHQIHCLAMLRGAFYHLLEDPGVATQMIELPNEFNITKHLEHCFDYLRQGIMCAADPTIESVHHNVGSSRDDGWGNTHVCRSWDALKGFVESRRASDLSGLSLDHYFNKLKSGHSGASRGSKDREREFSRP